MNGRRSLARMLSGAMPLLLMLSAKTPAEPARWTSLGPPGGQVTGFAFHPKNSAIVFATVGSGDVYRSRDRGMSWQRLEPPSIHGVVRLRFGPEDPPRLYLGSEHSLYVSRTLGAGWRKVSDFGSNCSLTDFQFHPKVHGLMYALLCCGGGVLRSNDFGKTWKNAGAGLPAGALAFGMAVDPHDSRTLYVTLDRSIYKTVDQGASWKEIATPDCHNAPYMGNIVVHPRNSSILLAGMWGSSSCTLKSTDHGASWKVVNYANGQELAYNSVRPAWVYSAGNGISRSTDGGTTWSRAPIPRRYWNRILSLESHPLLSNLVLAGSDLNGIYRSNDSGSTWHTASRGMNSLGVVALESTGPGALLACGLNWQLFRRESGNKSWRIVSRFQENRVEQIAVFRRNPQVVAVAGSFQSGTNFAVSADGGLHWSFSEALQGPASLESRILCFSGRNPRVLMMSVFNRSGAYAGIARSMDQGTTWNLSNAGLTDTRIRKILASPDRSSTFYVLVERSSSVFRSTNSGGNWEAAGNPLPSNEYPADIAVSPGRIYLLSGNATTHVATLYSSTTQGKSWTRLVRFAPHDYWAVDRIAADPVNRLVVFAMVSRGSGVMKSADGGTTWAALPTPPYGASELLVDSYASGTYYIRTSHGVYSLNESNFR
jgi:photosystem II stability/assembly factor-like uncharacterized protein